MIKFTAIIPARYASTRLPGKPLLTIAGKPMVQHVYERACASDAEQVIVATDDSRIEAAVKAFGGNVMLTSPDHASGTDRLGEVARKLQLDDDAIVVGVQGDEPLVPPQIINQVANNLAKNQQASIATLKEKILTIEEVMNPNAVKVVCDRQDMALYFSRAPIPFGRDEFSGKQLPEQVSYFRHIGLYAYRVKFLHDYAGWSQCELETAEKLEQLRAMWHGAKIHVELANEKPFAGVDTEADLEQVRQVVQRGG